jgi:hypothetical protein
MTVMKRLTLILTLLTLSMSSNAEEDYVQHSAHVHGITALEIAQDSNELELGLISPAYNLIGFEHQPGNEVQKKRVTEVMTLLKRPERVLRLDNKADCELLSVEVESALADNHASAAMADDDHEAQHDDEHEHEHEHHQETEHQAHEQEGKAHNHSDIQVHYRFQCANPQALNVLEIDLFSHFPLIEEIHAQIITQSTQREVVLTPGATRILLSN